MKDFVLSMYYHSSKCYKFIRKTFMLPAVATLQNWQNRVSVKIGIDNNALAALKGKASDFSESERMVALVFDEISIKEHLQYDCSIDTVVGFCNSGEKQTPMLGTPCLVVMVKGLVKRWKQCLRYWVTCCTNNPTYVSSLKNNLLNCISRMSDIGYTVKIVICDQSTHDQSLCRTLGVSTKFNHFSETGMSNATIFGRSHRHIGKLDVKT